MGKNKPSKDNNKRIVRGGSWRINPASLRVALHNGYFFNSRGGYLGFRATRIHPKSKSD